ncbi:MAG: valine--tRNA ligase [Candidatus Firestonebacteria bacterium RIFOXYC2_FULL_39_67]|nr:MAG: valine--tRNA ligase [Candidatus Firestonebacteria bacterium RIFOXYC2_FULL_39_67]
MVIRELSKRYEPKEVEAKWCNLWLSKNYFTADASDDKKPQFSLVIPPPNVTGALHMGHALNSTIQDALARYKRMQGFNVLWLPGTDHAGIATQNVVEKELRKEGKTRHDLGREEFVKKVWEWKEKYGSTIINQLKTMGCSCDWTRERFTMDEGLSNAVKTVFVALYREGLIYRGNYIVNWCPRCHTALSDIEVEYKDTKGHFWHLKYPVKGENSFVVVATTRPETMLGDTAVAVNPKDERWNKFIGKSILLPIMNREIKVIGDEMVDMELGTGAVKVTPAHDQNDFTMGKKHGLEEIIIMDNSAVLNENAGKYKGKDRFTARKEIVAELDTLGLLLKVEDYQHSVGSCSRCETVVEPIISLQWFVKMKPLAEPAIRAVKDGKVKFVPAHWEDTYYQWMENIRDWCISRQLWWGHRLPVWYCKKCKEIIVDMTAPEKCPACGGAVEQDPDVLDTWFSSALWPFSTMGWPEETDFLKKFYPTSVLSTAFDIIFFWVARMIMMGIKFRGEVPFKEVYIHALIRDSEGKKMSKSKGNVIDPLVVLDKYGTDALRFTLGVQAAQGRDIYLSDERFEGYRNFVNKLWNASRFVLMNLEGFDRSVIKPEKLQLTLADRWMLSKFNRLVEEVTKNLGTYNFDKAAQGLYDFLWHEFCDWYIELAKPRMNVKNLDSLKTVEGKHTARETVQFIISDTLEKTLRLLHPFMPFVTEEIWQSLPHEGESIMKSKWPEAARDEIKKDIEEEMELVKNIINAIRNARSEGKVNPGVKIRVNIKTKDEVSIKAINNSLHYIMDLAKVEKIEVGPSVLKPELSVTAVLPKLEIFVILEGLIDLGKEKERLAGEIEKITLEIEKAKVKLSNESFLQRAPVEVIAIEKKKQQDYIEKKQKLEENLERMRK